MIGTEQSTCVALQGVTQGPCSILQFNKWLQAMAGKPHLQSEFQQFKDVSVWRVRPLSPATAQGGVGCYRV